MTHSICSNQVHRKMKIKLLYHTLLICITLSACVKDTLVVEEHIEGKTPITLNGEIDHVVVTRVNESGFCSGDKMGVYVVDYEGSVPGTLQARGNRADNVEHTFDKATHKWNSAYDVYWKDKHTHIDVYGYYPFSYAYPENVEAVGLVVERDQSTPGTEEILGGYEASDFLWGKVGDVAPTTNTIRLPMTHRMANARVTLVEGAGFAEGEWAKLEKSVLVTNLCRKATVNLTTGEVTRKGDVEKTATQPICTGDEWRAIVVPQTVAAGIPLFNITVGGISYKFAKSEDFTYVAGKISNFSIRVNKKTDTGKYEFTLIGESITAWENDWVSHDANAREYIIIETTPGNLKKSIIAANKDYTQLRNLKLKGSINEVDFNFMKKEMTNLQILNLKEVRVFTGNEEGVIPDGALYGKSSLVRLILPDKLYKINNTAFEYCVNLTGSLTIPEGVTYIGGGAFYCCGNLYGTLSLPSTLTYIGDRAFWNCGFTCDLVLPDKLTYIGEDAFMGCVGLSGQLQLPSHLEYLGSCAFSGCAFRGDLLIPQSIKIIKEGTFGSVSFGGALTLHDGITEIRGGAFFGCKFKGGLNLPKHLTIISETAFRENEFSGELKLPQSLLTIGSGAFSYNPYLTGTLELPKGLTNIGSCAFQGCSGIKKLVFPANLENIQNEAFSGCYQIGSIVCKGEIPPNLTTNAFSGVSKDNFTVEVPEQSVTLYQTTPGWNEFKRIVAHHELVCSPSVVYALNTTREQTLILDAEGKWEVESMPDWCSLSQTSGDKKTKLTLTIHNYSKGSVSVCDRIGKIVFRLTDEEYTCTCTVDQYDYEYDEDQLISLQTATQGNNGGINIVILGDGYDAYSIINGNYLAHMKLAMENFFDVEPYKTYRNYFNVYTSISLSQEAGVGSVNGIRNNKFGTIYTGDACLEANYNALFASALKAPTVNEGNLKETLIIVVPNCVDYGGCTHLWTDGSAISFCPMNTYEYPGNTRGVVHHEAGGHGFGKLGDENISYNAFIDNGHTIMFNSYKAIGWYDNLSLTGKMNEVPWKHFILDSRYNTVVDIFEGGYSFTRGVFRSEQNSCMNNSIPYFNAISRESIVKRIKRYAGEKYSFDEFVANDNIDAAVTRNKSMGTRSPSWQRNHAAPRIHRGSPLKNKR